MGKRIIAADRTRPPSSCYSDAVQSWRLVFTSGQWGLNGTTGRPASGGIEKQTLEALRRIQGLVEEAGLIMQDVVSVNVFLADLRDFRRMDKIYRKFFPKEPPARTTVQAHLFRKMFWSRSVLLP